MSNFTFLQAQWPAIYEAAANSEKYLQNDIRATCFYARYTIEQLVNWLYDVDKRLTRPTYVANPDLSTLLQEPCFITAVPQTIREKLRVIRKLGNMAVHGNKITPADADTSVRELFHVAYWLGRNYTSDPNLTLPLQFDSAKVPPSIQQLKAYTTAQLQELVKQLKDKDEKLREQNQQIADFQAQIAALQAQIASAQTKTTHLPDPHNYSEAETRRYLIDVLMREAGWDLDLPNAKEYEVIGMPNRQSLGKVDYVLWGADGKPLAAVEAKRTTLDAEKGKIQVELYARALEKMHGQRPFIFYTNGYEIWFWDDLRYPPRPVQGFYSPQDLDRLMQRRKLQQPLASLSINNAIVDRYYQHQAIKLITERLEKENQRRALLVMATGTGKTRTIIALIDLLMRANWVKKVLFLADRAALVNQTKKAFEAHLSAVPSVNLLKNKLDKDSRIVVSTYHTMMNQIDQFNEQEQRFFTAGYFDLIIVDEAHRSIYQKFRAIFDYFDSYLIGLTATPRQDVDRNTYELFHMGDGVPTFAYELEQAVNDGYLVPPRQFTADFKFLRQGIKYADLSEAEKEKWDNLEWNEEEPPLEVSAAELNTWLFNEDTIDKALALLMERGLKIKGGVQLGKTIIFARNKEHAHLIVQRFDEQYPTGRGKFAAVVVHDLDYVASKIDDFGTADEEPFIAVSVDMLDTGIDVPEVVNLLFFKPIHSKTKFTQMIGRGTRLRPHLFGPDQHKTEFFIFDLCGNFEYFDTHPEDKPQKLPEPLPQKLFKARLTLWHTLRQLPTPQQAEYTPLITSLENSLHHIVAGISLTSFLVRPHYQLVETYQKREKWAQISPHDRTALLNHVSGLPSRHQETEELPLRFDRLILKLQQLLLDGERDKLLALGGDLLTIAEALADDPDLTHIAQVQNQRPLLEQILDEQFWNELTLGRLEDVRLNVRSLMRFVPRQQKVILITDFDDKLLKIEERDTTYTTTVNVELYKAKLSQFIQEHQDVGVIGKLRRAEPITAGELYELETFFQQVGQFPAQDLLHQIYDGPRNLGRFVRQVAGLDQPALARLLSQYIQQNNFNSQQIHFVQTLLEYTAVKGRTQWTDLTEWPFTDKHPAGVFGLFDRQQQTNLQQWLAYVEQTAVPLEI